MKTALPTEAGVYQDQDGRGFVLYRGHWFRLVMGREVRPDEMAEVQELVPLSAASGNAEPPFKPFRARHVPTKIEEAP